VYVYVQPSLSDFTSSEAIVGRGKNTTLDVRLLDDVSTAMGGYIINFTDMTDAYDIGNDTTDSGGYSTIIYTVPDAASLGLHTLNASYAGSAADYILPVDETVQITVGSTPQISNITVTPSTVGFGYDIVIRANVSDEGVLDKILINISDGSTISQYEMNDQGGDYYNYTFNETWEANNYSFIIIANNTGGVSSESSSYTFDVAVYTNITIKTDKESYENYEKVYLNSSVSIINNLNLDRHDNMYFSHLFFHEKAPYRDDIQREGINSLSYEEENRQIQEITCGLQRVLPFLQWNIISIIVRSLLMVKGVQFWHSHRTIRKRWTWLHWVILWEGSGTRSRTSCTRRDGYTVTRRRRTHRVW